MHSAVSPRSRTPVRSRIPEELCAAYRKGELKSLTTGEAAALVNLSQQTIIRACDAGALLCWKVPGSKFRRVNPQDLIAWCREYDLPCPLVSRILLVAQDRACEYVNGIKNACRKAGFSEVVVSHSMLDAAMEIATSAFAAIILHDEPKMTEQLRRSMRERVPLEKAPVLILSPVGTETSIDPSSLDSYTAFCPTPENEDAVYAALCRVLSPLNR